MKEMGREEIRQLPKKVGKVAPLFERIDKDKIEEEKQKLVQQSALD